MLEARGVTKYFRHRNKQMQTLRGIDLDVADGEIVSLLGPSGCGKSTFLRIVAGLEKPDGGSILLEGRPVAQPGPDRIMVFQEGALFPWLNVRDNVEYGLMIAEVPPAERNRISSKYLDMMRLGKFADSYIHQLSVGMKQRVAIARSLVMKPRMLLMDEPFAALDVSTRNHLLREVHHVWKKTGTTILFVTHNVVEASVMGSRVAVFSRRPSIIKKVIEVGRPHPRDSDDPGLLPVQQEIRALLHDETG